ncbi:hypothetical protein R6Q57_010929 [Mikania cordata]
MLPDIMAVTEVMNLHIGILIGCQPAANLHYFDLTQYHNTEYWDGIKLGIQADYANRYKDRQTKLKKHFDKEGGYDNTARAKQNPPKGMDPEEWVQVIDGMFTTSTYKNRYFKNTANRSKQLCGSYHGTQSYTQRRYDEENNTNELNKAKSTSGGDDTPVDEVEVLQRSLDQRGGHVRANARWAEQQRINEMIQQQIKKLMSMQGGQGSSSFYYPGFETNQEKDQDQDEDEDEDESE